MIKNIKLFVNDRKDSVDCARLVKGKLIGNGFNVVDEDYELAIAIGGDGTFLKMVKDTDFNSDVNYVGINAGHLGFLQEARISEVNRLIYELKNDLYKVINMSIQETKVKHALGEDKFYSMNEMIVRDKDLSILKSKVYINDDFLENYVGDGLMFASSTGSTAYNLSFGGSIVSPEFSTLQITPMAPINSSVYRTIPYSIILSDKDKVKLVPENKTVLVTVDGKNIVFENVDNIVSQVSDKKVKSLRFSHYNFAQKINEKLL